MKSNHVVVGPDRAPKKEKPSGRLGYLCAESSAYYNSIPYIVAFFSVALVIAWLGLLAEALP